MRQIHGVALAALCALHAAPAAWAAPRLPAQDLGPTRANGRDSALDSQGKFAGTIVAGDALVEAVAIIERDHIACNSANGRVHPPTPVAR